MVSTSFLSYLLPLSLLQAGTGSHPRPTPSSSSRTSLGLPLLRTLRSPPNTSYPVSVARGEVADQLPTGLQLVTLDDVPTRPSQGGKGQGQRENEAVPSMTEALDDNDDLEWYYDAADEVELHQEQELWKWLLNDLAANSKDVTKVANLFKDLIVGVERGSVPGGRSPLRPTSDSALSDLSIASSYSHVQPYSALEPASRHEKKTLHDQLLDIASSQL